MKIILLLSLLLTISCRLTITDKEGREIEPELDPVFFEHRWRHPISCNQVEGCTYRTLKFSPLGKGIYLEVRSYIKNPIMDDEPETFIDLVDYDFTASDTMSGVAEPINAPATLIISAEKHPSIGRMTICLNGECSLYDAIQIDSL